LARYRAVLDPRTISWRPRVRLAGANSRSTDRLFARPGRTRTCNQTVMSNGITNAFVDFAAFSFEFDYVRCIWRGRFWCETGAVAESGIASSRELRHRQMVSVIARRAHGPSEKPMASVSPLKRIARNDSVCCPPCTPTRWTWHFWLARSSSLTTTPVNREPCNEHAKLESDCYCGAGTLYGT
jgi:hypothetical protein